jgi:glc operon protein GlcG
VSLTLDDANRVIEGALAKAGELNLRVCVAVCDAGGRLVAFQRMDRSPLVSLVVSQGKAVTSAALGRASGDAPDTALLSNVVSTLGGVFVSGKGGMPLIRDGVVAGACGVSGATWDQDEICVKAGVERF